MWTDYILTALKLFLTLHETKADVTVSRYIVTGGYSSFYAQHASPPILDHISMGAGLAQSV
jgi:hypothetical protein